MCSFCITFLLLAYKNRHTDQSSQLGLISELPVSAEFDHLLGRGIALAAAGADKSADELEFVDPCGPERRHTHRIQSGN
jgi:hypothetical protein